MFCCKLPAPRTICWDYELYTLCKKLSRACVTRATAGRVVAVPAAARRAPACLTAPAEALRTPKLRDASVREDYLQLRLNM